MLYPAQIIPFLSHDDSDLRAHASRYLALLAERAPDDAAAALWQAIDSFGKQVWKFGILEANTHFRALQLVPMNDAPITRAIDAVRACAHRQKNRD